MEIKAITEDGQIEEAAGVIRDSFATVASDLNLNRENCPTHPSFTTKKELIEMKERGTEFFGMYVEEGLVGFVALEKAGEELCYLEKLASLPKHRHKGYGGRMVDIACTRAGTLGARKVSVGIINEQVVLKSWYKGLGFIEKETKSYPHLPFTVCFMEKELP